MKAWSLKLLENILEACQIEIIAEIFKIFLLVPAYQQWVSVKKEGLT